MEARPRLRVTVTFKDGSTRMATGTTVADVASSQGVSYAQPFLKVYDGDDPASMRLAAGFNLGEVLFYEVESVDGESG